MAVLDTSTLQAIHRAGVLDRLQSLYDGGVFIPYSVEVQTRAAFESLGVALVPNLDALPWIRVLQIAATERRAHEAPPRGKARVKGQVSRKRPLCHGLAVDAEEYDVVLLALRLGADSIVDDHSGLRCAASLGVQARTTRQVLEALEERDLLGASLRERISKIEVTGYIPTTKRPKRT